MVKYNILTCSRTRQVWRALKTVDAWVPLFPDERLALHGYVFVPSHHMLTAIAALPVCLRARPVYFDEVRWEFRAVDVTELIAMQTAINKSIYTAPNIIFVPVVGQMVRFKCPPFDNLIGRVDKVHKDTCRVLLGTKFVTTAHSLLEEVR